MSKSHNEYQNPPASRKSLAFCGKTWIVVLLIVVLTFLLAKYSQLKAIAAGIQPADANEWKKLLAAHPYQPPPPGASRGPCPALNTLANHGFLPRDGRNITADQLFEAVLTVGLPPVHTYLVVKGVFHTYRHNHPSDSFLSNFRSMPSLDLHLLTTHNLLEHDVSLSRQDDNVAPHDAAVVQPQFVERLAQMAVDGFVLDKHVADHRKIRWLESLRDNKLLHFTLRMQVRAICAGNGVLGDSHLAFRAADSPYRVCSALGCFRSRRGHPC